MSIKLPPSPKGSPLLGHLKGFKTDPINFMLDSAEECGDILLFKMLNKKIYFLNKPEYIKHVLHTNHKNYHKSPGYKPLRLVGGMGIFTSDGELWLKQRKLYQPAFSHQSIKNYSGIVINNTNELLNEWKVAIEKGDKINLSEYMMRITMGIISETMFSKRVEYQTGMWEAMNYVLEWIGDRALRNPFVLPAKWPTKKNKRFWESTALLNEIIYKVIDDKKKDNSNPDDLLSRFMNPEGDLEGLSPKELRDEVMTIFVAGHETTANVLMWTFHVLTQHPEIEEKLHEEVKKLGDRELNYEDLHHLLYTAQVCNEVMRLYPPVWHLGRMNLEADKIGDYEIPPGSHVRMSPLTTHRHPNYWENPEVFNPDRFEKEQYDRQKPFSFIPFGGGPRLCAGRNFAMMEMVLMLAKIVQKVKLAPNQKSEVEMAPLMTLRPKQDVILQFELR
ncbi:MAG: cytochrome P450 [Flavobacteriales bacterium]|nr:cytochrome P450 [Flavobacteriales bacterium]